MSELLDRERAQPAGVAPVLGETPARGSAGISRDARIGAGAEICALLAALGVALAVAPRQRLFVLLPTAAFLIAASCYGVFEPTVFDRCRWAPWRRAVFTAVAAAALSALDLHITGPTVAVALGIAGTAVLSGRAARESCVRLQLRSCGRPLAAVVVHSGWAGSPGDVGAAGSTPPIRVVASVQVAAGPQSGAGSAQVDAEVAEVLSRARPDVVLAVPGGGVDATVLQRLDWLTADFGVPLCLWLGLPSVSAARLRLQAGPDGPVLSVRAPAYRRQAALAAKAAVERLAAALVLIMAGLPMLMIALLVRSTSTGPALFVQHRVGRVGRNFPMYKFRTMRRHAEAELPQLLTLNAHAEGPMFKMANDPRITPVGRRLRRSSLDELPQLINVIRGEMALIGPRPPLPVEVAAYDDATRRRLLVKPGLTGLWQVSGRAELSWADSCRLDLYYVDNWSLRLDLQILWRTAGAVLGRKGAY